jgi:hypothetical protein
MEVHHHPNVEKKSFKAYFLEFLMIFLAVTMGFFAENIREHLGEGQKEKEYISSLVKDLEYDTAEYRDYIRSFERRLPFFDSVIRFLNAPAAYNNRLSYKFWGRTDYIGVYIPEEPTIQQLKNSGNLRLLKNNKILDSVLVYDSHIQGTYLSMVNYLREFHQHLGQVKEKVLDISKFSQYLDDFNRDKVNENDDYGFTVVARDREAINELIGSYVNLKSADVYYIWHLKERNKEAENLLTLIKKEYYWGNE